MQAYTHARSRQRVREIERKTRQREETYKGPSEDELTNCLFYYLYAARCVRRLSCILIFHQQHRLPQTDVRGHLMGKEKQREAHLDEPGLFLVESRLILRENSNGLGAGDVTGDSLRRAHVTRQLPANVKQRARSCVRNN
jgi:hypothetical protein